MAQTHVLVVDDVDAKVDFVHHAITEIKNRDASARYEVVHLRSIELLVDMLEEEGPAGLARFDVVLVDFNFGTLRYGGIGPNFTVEIPGKAHGEEQLKEEQLSVRRTEEVELTTGVGVMLLLAQVIESPEYVAARGAPKKTVVYSYVDLREPTSHFFAAAAWLWFGAPVFALRTGGMADQLKTLGHAGVFQESVEEAAVHLDALLDFATVEKKPFGWVAEGRGRDSYAWLRTLQRTAVSEDVNEYRRDGLIATKRRTRLGLLATVKVDQVKQLHNNLVARLYEQIKNITACYDPSEAAAWPASLDGDVHSAEFPYKRAAVRPVLRQALDRSQEFWTADDVALALKWYQATRDLRSQVAGRAGRG